MMQIAQPQGQLVGVVGGIAGDGGIERSLLQVLLHSNMCPPMYRVVFRDPPRFRQRQKIVLWIFAAIRLMGGG